MTKVLFTSCQCCLTIFIRCNIKVNFYRIKFYLNSILHKLPYAVFRNCIEDIKTANQTHLFRGTKTKWFISSAHQYCKCIVQFIPQDHHGRGRRSIQLPSHALYPLLDMQKSSCLCAAFSCVFCELNAAHALWDSYWSVGNAAIDWVRLDTHVF